MKPLGNGKYARQGNAAPELRMVSQPPGYETIHRFNDFVYRSDTAREIFVYHAELGINSEHVDFQGRKIQWLYTGQSVYRGQATQNESRLGDPDFHGHSTCTASKATGSIFGAVKFVILVVVKMLDLKAGSVTEIFATIADDIRLHNRQYRSIVSVSWASKQPISRKYPHYRLMKADIEELTRQLSVPIIFAAGNDALEKETRIPRLRRMD